MDWRCRPTKYDETRQHQSTHPGDLIVRAPATAAECADQEASLVLERLTAADAMAIGQSIVELPPAWVPGRPVAVHLEIDDHPLFIYFMDGTGAANADWIVKKKNVTRRFGRSSWAVRLEFLERRADFQAETGLDPNQFRAEGWAVPLVIRSKGWVSTVVGSDLDGWEDHARVVGGLARWMGKAQAGGMENPQVTDCAEYPEFLSVVPLNP
jgi:uncharacterized protein (UPF0303 family)